MLKPAPPAPADGGPVSLVWASGAPFTCSLGYKPLLSAIAAGHCPRPCHPHPLLNVLRRAGGDPRDISARVRRLLWEKGCRQRFWQRLWRCLSTKHGCRSTPTAPGGQAASAAHRQVSAPRPAPDLVPHCPWRGWDSVRSS